MSVYITEECIVCGACEPKCPTEAISESYQGDIYVVDPELCTECVGHHSEVACQSVCPVKCCLPNPSIPETEDKLVERVLKILRHDENLAERIRTGSYPSHFRE